MGLTSLVAAIRRRGSGRYPVYVPNKACDALSLLTLPFVDTPGLVDVGKCALQVAHPAEDDGAVDVGVGKIRIEIDRQIEVGQCKRKVAAAIGSIAPL